MDSRKSKKSRSIAIEPRTSRPVPANAQTQLVDRTRSDPAVARRRPSQTQSHSQGQSQKEDNVRISDVRISDVSDRDSKTSIRDDPFFRLYQSPQSTRSAAESRTAHGLVNRNEDVGSPPEASSSSPHMPPSPARLLHGDFHVDCLNSSPARMQIFLRSTSLCWEAAGSESQPSFRGPWTFDQMHQALYPARRCPWTA